MKGQIAVAKNARLQQNTRVALMEHDYADRQLISNIPYGSKNKNYSEVQIKNDISKVDIKEEIIDYCDDGIDTGNFKEFFFILKKYFSIYFYFEKFEKF